MATTFNRIDRAHISDAVLQELLDQLLSGNLRVGDRLPSDAEIAEQLGAGRNSVREAMKVLQVLGVVDRRQGDGSYVSSGGSNAFEILLFALVARIHEPRELVELRKVFEVGVVELLIPRITEEQIDSLEAMTEQLASFQGRNPLPIDEAVDIDSGFHLEIVKCTGNQALMALANLIMRLVQNSMREHLSDPAGFIEAIKDHRATLDALRARDGQRAIQVINRSFDLWQRYIQL